MTLNEIWSDVRYRLRSVFRRRAVEAELDEELRFHVERETDKLVASGYAAFEARRIAALTFGGVSRMKEDTRDAHGTATFDQLAQDVRYALRGLRARPLFTVVVIGTLGLGVGVNAAMFGIIDQLMLRPPRYLRDPATVHRVFITWSGPDGSRTPQQSLEYLRYLDFRRWTRATSELAAFSTQQIAMGEGDATREVSVGIVSASLFDFFDAKPVLGRFFTASEDQLPSGEAVAVLSHATWETQFGGRADAIGSRIKLGSLTYRVIGVAPRGFAAFDAGSPPAAFIPITAFAYARTPDFYKNYNWGWLRAVVRRKHGVSVTAASADVTNAFVRSWNAERAMESSLASAEVVRPEAFVTPVLLARGPAAGPESRVLLWVGGVAAIVLIVACANVANLLLARSLRRRRELAVRRALGGSRARLVRQLLTETGTLSVLGGIAGLLGAQIASGAVRRVFAPEAEPMPLVTDARTVFFALLLVIVTALLAGLLPAVHAGRDDVAGTLRGGKRDTAYRGARSRRVLLVFQTALSVVLLVGAGLFVRSLQAIRALRLGYDVDRIVLVSPNLRGVKLAGAAATQLSDQLLAAADAIPGVERAALTGSVPFWSFEGRSLHVPGIDSVRKLGRFSLYAGSADYFSTIGTRVVRGRGFTSDDRAAAPYVAVVSEAMAKVLWKSDDPIGKCFRVGSDTMPCTTVVGVAENTRGQQLRNDAELAYYLPYDQYRAEFGSRVPFLYVRVHGHADDYAETVRSHLQRVMPGASYVTAIPFHAIVDPHMRSWTSGATMFSALGGLALALAAIGLYAVIAFGVAQRVHEIGIRIALGALPRDVLRLIVGEGVRVTFVGVVFGGAVALVAGRFVAPMLFNVSPRDPLVFATVTAILVAVGVVASVVPAARAAAVDPNIALRAE